MIVDSYKVCSQIATSLKSVILAGNEINEVQLYSETNFNTKCKIYNQIAVDKSKYTKPYIAINEIGQSQENRNTIQIDIDFAIPVADDKIDEIEVDGVIEYKDYYKLSEFANVIIDRIQTKGNVCYPYSQILFRPNEISIKNHEYSGSIQITYQVLTPISK